MTHIPNVKEYMKTDIVRLKPAMSIQEAIRILLKHKISGACVEDEDGKLIGMLSEKDCLRIFAVGAFNQHPIGDVAQYMSKDLKVLSPDDGLFQAVSIFLKNPFRRLPVVEDGVLVGQVTRDLVLEGTRHIWEESPVKKPWTDSTYLTEEIKAALK